MQVARRAVIRRAKVAVYTAAVVAVGGNTPANNTRRPTMSENEVLSFDLTQAEQPVKIGDEDYVLVELNGLERDTYLNDVGGRMRTGPDGKPTGVKNFKGMQAALLTASLKKVIPDGKRQVVTANTIQGWRAKVISKLFDLAKELSDIGNETPELPKVFADELLALGVEQNTIDEATANILKKVEEGND